MRRGGGSSGSRQRRLCSNLAHLALVTATSSLVRSIGSGRISLFISCLNPLIYCRVGSVLLLMPSSSSLPRRPLLFLDSPSPSSLPSPTPSSLQEPAEELKLHALASLKSVVHLLYPETSTSIPTIW